MPRITVTKEYDVPDGEYCGCCQNHMHIHHMNDICIAFNEYMESDSHSYNGQIIMRKCQPCLDACAEVEDA